MSSFYGVKLSFIKRAVLHQLGQSRQAIINEFGERIYDACRAFLPAFYEDVDRYQGRVAKRSKKSMIEYSYADSRCMMDYACINGSRMLLDTVWLVLFNRLKLIELSKSHDWEAAECARYTAPGFVLKQATGRDLRDKRSSGEQKKQVGVSLTNIGDDTELQDRELSPQEQMALLFSCPSAHEMDEDYGYPWV
jgi:hypothetical protein